MAITGVIRGISREKINQELGLESLQNRRWYRKLTTFYNILNSEATPYLFELIPVNNNHYTTSYAHEIPIFKVKHDFFKTYFFPLQ